MSDRIALATGWLQKSESDRKAAGLALDGNLGDVACFHSQQLAERVLKAYLVWNGVSFPFTHNLSRLLDICGKVDAAFLSLIPVAETLTPYAVEFRYDVEFWPERSVARKSLDSALTIRAFILERLPDEMKTVIDKE